MTGVLTCALPTIIEAMKIMNEIESDFDGVLTEIKVDSGNPVEYNQILFIINPL